MSPKKKYTFFITDELDKALKALKKRDGIPEAEAVRRALTAFLTEKGALEKREIKSASRRARTPRKA